MRYFDTAEQAAAEMVHKAEEERRRVVRYTEALEAWEAGSRSVSDTFGLGKRDLVQTITHAAGRAAAYEDAADMIAQVREETTR